MSFATLERAVLAEAKSVLNNRGLRKKDIIEWSTGDVKAEDGEVVVRCPELGVNVCVKKEHDKRKEKKV
jgi:hypothetical protein